MPVYRRAVPALLRRLPTPRLRPRLCLNAAPTMASPKCFSSAPSDNDNDSVPEPIVKEWKRPSQADLALDYAQLTDKYIGKDDEYGHRQADIAKEVFEAVERGDDEAVKSRAKTEELQRSLTPSERRVAELKLQEWRKHFKSEWKRRDLVLSQRRLRLGEELRDVKDVADRDAIISRRAALDATVSQETLLRDLINEALPGIAASYARSPDSWSRNELEQLDLELKLSLSRDDLREFAKTWMKRNPLRQLGDDALASTGVEPTPVRLDTFLESIDPRVAQRNRDLGEDDSIEPHQREMIDLSDPIRVMEVMLDHGYDFMADGSIQDVDREVYALEPHQRRLLREGIDEKGRKLTGPEYFDAVSKSLQLTSRALELKTRRIMGWAIGESRRSGKPRQDPDFLKAHPELLPEELRPTLEDLDPDAKPPREVFVQTFNECPVCQRPRHVRKKCYKPADDGNISYMNVELLTKFVNEYGMILPRHRTNICAKYQRKVARAIKRSRQMGLMPYNSKLKFGDETSDTSFELFDAVQNSGAFDADGSSSNRPWNQHRNREP